MRRRYTTSDHLRLRYPMPQLDIGNLAPGEPAIVQDDPPQEVAPQTENAPQQVQSVAPPSTSTLQLASGTTSQSVRVDRASTPTLGPSASFEFSPSTSSSAILSTASPISSLLSSTISAASSSLPVSSSLVPSSSPTSSWSSITITPSSLSSSTSSSSSPAASPAALHHPAASTSPAVIRRPSTLTHGAPLYAALALGALILFASLASLTALLIRARLRARRRAAALTNIAWDPVVLADAKPHTNNSNSDNNGNEFAGDRDVGEPKRSESFVSRRGSSASYASFYHPSAYHHQQQQPPDLYPQHPNPFDGPGYYAPHPHPPLADSAAYPLPPMPASMPPVASRNSERGPYPTTRPLPAYLADRDPHRLSIDNANSRRSATASTSSTRGSGNTTRSATSSTTRSAASSRTGSLRSHLQSASTLGPLCLANGPRSSSGSGSGEESTSDASAPPQLAEFDFATPESTPAHEFGTPRERHARPRFMALPSGRGLDVPWRRQESFSVRGGGGGAGRWTPLDAPAAPVHDAAADEGRNGSGGWTDTIRASVRSALMAVTGAAMSGAPEDGHRDAEDGLTHAPTMGRARERRESGWRRFEAMEEESGGGRKGSISSRSSREVPYIPDNRNSDMLPPPGMSVGMSLGTGTSMSMQSMRTEHSSAPLIAKPRPALVARTSSVYSTGSAVPAYGQEPGHGHGHGYAYA